MSKLEFLEVPLRPKKPRQSGLTVVIDSGAGYYALDDLLSSAAFTVDFVKFGWGSALVTECLNKKIALLREYGVDFWFGGTLFEIAFAQQRFEAFCDWAEEKGARHFEVSCGKLAIAGEEKAQIIRRLAGRFVVLSEVGSKDSSHETPPYKWIEEIKRELDAGSWKIIAEGRESGRAGIYRDTGDVRQGLITEIVDAGISVENLIFEAPNTVQQLWFLQQFGSNINLGNIRMQDAIGLETLRLGLRADTMGLWPVDGCS